MQLRPLDLKIIACLQEDARRPFTAIAAELGVPESTVRKRVGTLQQRGVLQFSAFADPLRLGFQHWALIRCKVTLSRLTKVADRVAAFSEAFFIGLTSGEYNLFTGAIFQSHGDLLEFLNTRLFTVAGVEKTSTSNLLEVVKRRGPLVDGPGVRRASVARRPSRPPQGVPDGRSPIEPIDVRIIEELQEDGRRPCAQVATAIHVSESQVQKRVARLRDLGVLTFVTFTDPKSLGLQQWMMLDLVVDPPRIKSVTSAVAEFPEIVFVGLTTGEHDIFATGIFRSNDDVLDFLTRRLARVPGITGTSTTSVIRVVKRQLVFPVGSRLGR